MFQIVDPKPEAKLLMKVSHVAAPRTTIVVKKLSGLQLGGTGGSSKLLKLSDEGTVTVDLLRWCTKENFSQLIEACASWDVGRSGIAVVPARRVVSSLSHF